MKRILSLALLSVFATSSYAFELQSLRSSDLTLSAAPVTPASAPAAVSRPKARETLWMTVNSNPSWQEAEADDFSAGIEARVRKTGSSFFSASLRVDNRTEFVHLSKFGNGFSLSGSGISLNVSEFGGSYGVNGTVDGKFVNVNLFQRFNNNGHYFYANAYGINLDFGPGGVNGSYEDSEYSKKAVAAVVTMMLAAHVDKMPAQKAERNGERVWLTYSNNGNFGWNDMEATDPFADIEVNIRKIFNKEYDAEIELGTDRQSGRVSNFFSDRWEYRGRGGDLQLRQWGGFNDLEGTVTGADGKAVRVNMRANVNFGSLSVNENGLRLYADRNGVHADIDTAVYPKSLVAYVAAIVMAMQHSALNPNQP